MSDEAYDIMVAKVAAEVEKSIFEQEAKKSRNLYIVFGFISFIGFGVISQLVDFYATKAVESKLATTIDKIESVKIPFSLQALAMKLDFSDSFTNSDMSAIMTLLTAAKDNGSIRSDISFPSLLEKIVDAFALSNNSDQLDRVFDMYRDVCLMNTGISVTLLQHYGRNYLSSVNVNSASSVDTYDRFNSVIRSITGGKARGAVWAFSLIVEYKRNGETKNDAITKSISDMSALNDDERDGFRKVLSSLSDPNKLGKKSTPEITNIVRVTSKFMFDYKNELSLLLY
ncbi:MAG: hypothetical protein AB7G62_02620 [Magnetospirillum sp.]